MIKFPHLLFLIVFCIFSIIECSNSIDKLLPGYYDGEIVTQFKNEWKKYQPAFENAVVSGLQENFGKPAINIYMADKRAKEPIARGFSLSDNVVKVYFIDLFLRDLPDLIRVKLNMGLPSNNLQLEAKVGQMFVDATYYVARNDTAKVAIRQHGSKLMDLSPFSLQNTDLYGKVAIIVEDCTLSGFSIATLSGDSVALGHSAYQLIDCKITVEISTPNTGAPPVIAPYFPDGPRKIFERVLSQPIREELETKLQAAMYSFVNTSVIFGNDKLKFKNNQQKLFKSYGHFIKDYVSKLNQNTLRANKGSVQMKNCVMSINIPDKVRTICSMVLNNLRLYGLETAYVSLNGGPLEPGGAAEAIVFSSMQIRGKVSHYHSNESMTNEFAAELTDVAVYLIIDIDNGKTEVKDLSFAGWRSLEFAIIPWATKHTERLAYESLVYGHLVNELPPIVIEHLTSILGGGGDASASLEKKETEGGSDYGNKEDELESGPGSGSGSIESKENNVKKDFFTDDNLDKEFFSNEDFFSDDNIQKDFFSDDHIDKSFFTGDNTKKDFFTDDNNNDEAADNNEEENEEIDINGREKTSLRAGFISDDILDKDFFSDDKKDFFSNDDKNFGFSSDDKANANSGGSNANAGNVNDDDPKNMVGYDTAQVTDDGDSTRINDAESNVLEDNSEHPNETNEKTKDVDESDNKDFGGDNKADSSNEYIQGTSSISKNVEKDFFSDDIIEKDFFTDDNIEKDFFTDDNIENDFFTDDNIEKDFLTDDLIEKNFLSDNIIEKDFFSDDHIEKDFFSDGHIEKDFLSEDHIEKDFFSDDNIDKDFVPDKEVPPQTSFISDDEQEVQNKNDNESMDEKSKDVGDDKKSMDVSDDNGKPNSSNGKQTNTQEKIAESDSNANFDQNPGDDMKPKSSSLNDNVLSDDVLDDNFFSDDGLDNNFFSDDGIDKNFFSDDGIDNNFFSDDNIERRTLPHDNYMAKIRNSSKEKNVNEYNTAGDGYQKKVAVKNVVNRNNIDVKKPGEITSKQADIKKHVAVNVENVKNANQPGLPPNVHNTRRSERRNFFKN